MKVGEAIATPRETVGVHRTIHVADRKSTRSEGRLVSLNSSQTSSTPRVPAFVRQQWQDTDPRASKSNPGSPPKHQTRGYRTPAMLRMTCVTRSSSSSSFSSSVLFSFLPSAHLASQPVATCLNDLSQAHSCLRCSPTDFPTGIDSRLRSRAWAHVPWSRP